jgi:hypothetical protein
VSSQADGWTLVITFKYGRLCFVGFSSGNTLELAVSRRLASSSEAEQRRRNHRRPGKHVGFSCFPGAWDRRTKDKSSSSLVARIQSKIAAETAGSSAGKTHWS